MIVNEAEWSQLIDLNWILWQSSTLHINLVHILLKIVYIFVIIYNGSSLIRPFLSDIYVYIQIINNCFYVFKANLLNY